MNFFHDEKALRRILFLLGVLVIGSSLLHLTAQLRIPGLEPIASALFWAALWRLNVVKKVHPGGIYTFLYLAIILLNGYAGFSQIWLAIRQIKIP